jgi:hypothetical protein
MSAVVIFAIFIGVITVGGAISLTAALIAMVKS